MSTDETDRLRRLIAEAFPHRPELEEAVTAHVAAARVARGDQTSPPDIKDGFVRLYRGQLETEPSPRPEMFTVEEWAEMQGAAGRWFVENLLEVQFYVDSAYWDLMHPSVVFIDVRREEAELWRIANLPADAPVRAYSRLPELEFFVPREVAARACALPGWQRLIAPPPAELRLSRSENLPRAVARQQFWIALQNEGL